MRQAQNHGLSRGKRVTGAALLAVAILVPLTPPPEPGRSHRPRQRTRLRGEPMTAHRDPTPLE